MAAIRDIASNYTSVAATSIPGYLPNNQAGDLLLAVVNTRVATQNTVAATGWTLYQTLFTTNLTTAILYKYATGSDTDPTFTYGTSSQSGVQIIAIQDTYNGATGVTVGGSLTPFNGTGGGATGATGIRSTIGGFAQRGLMPQLTTAANNSLILYIVTTNAVLVPMILEGPCVYEYGVDYSTSSSALSWTQQRTAGLTPSNVYYNITAAAGATGAATGTGSLITLGISPPFAGASLIPTYISADNSTYVDPINGVTAWGTNSAFSILGGASGATGTNYYYGASGVGATGSTGAYQTQLGGLITSSGTVAAAADTGLNSYHSMGQLTVTPVTAKTVKGAILNIGGAGATGLNVGTKNILCHLKPSNPVAYQTTESIGRPSAKGLFIGLNSGATGANYKVWHVHGSGTAFDTSTHVPVVINTGATGVAQGATGSKILSSRGTLDNTNIKTIGFFGSAVGVTAPIWQFGSIWVLDTTTVVGGNAANPIDIKGIVKAASTGKERLSLIQQGIAQALILQPIQFGDGGTNETYLNLDSSAIEFPNQYSVTKKSIFYNSIDNAVGITYYAGASDTIIHTNANILSANKYFWGFNASTSASATYNFAGTVIAGAGTVTLSANAPLTSMTFQSCDQIAANGTTLTSCVFSSTTATSGQGALSITGSTQAALQAALDKLVTCTFSNNVTAAGLRIIYTGAGGSTITLTNADKTFTGNTLDIYWDAPASTPLTFTQTTAVSNASLYASSNSNTVTINNTTTFVKINFDTYLAADGANAKYKMFYNQVNITGVGNVPGESRAYGTSSAVLVKTLSTDLSGDGSLEVKGDLTGNITTVTFNYDYIYNNQASWTKNTPYSVGDEYSYRVGATTTWYRVTTAYTSGSTRTSILDGANATALEGPTIVLVTIGTENAEYFKTTGTIIPFQTTVVSATSLEELNYASS